MNDNFILRETLLFNSCVSWSGVRWLLEGEKLFIYNNHVKVDITATLWWTYRGISWYRMELLTRISFQSTPPVTRQQLFGILINIFKTFVSKELS